MKDRTTQALLLAIALGLWANFLLRTTTESVYAPMTTSSAMPQRPDSPTDAGFVSPARRGRAERPEWLVRVYRESAQATRVARRSPQPRPSGSGPPAAPRVVEAPVSPVSPIVTPPRPRPELSPSAPPIPIDDDDIDDDIAVDSDLDIVAGASQVVDRATAVAILPFANISQGDTTDALGTGLAQDVSTRLGDLESVVVVSSETDADWVVGGGVQRLGDTVRVTARVVDTRDGDIVRAVKVDGATNDLGRVQARWQRQSRLGLSRPWVSGPISSRKSTSLQS